MKRLLCLAFALAVMGAASGCKPGPDKTAESENPPSNLKSYAEKGRLDSMPEIKIGDSPGRVAQTYHTTLEALDEEPDAGEESSESATSAPDSSGTESRNETEQSEAASGDGAVFSPLQKIGEGVVCLIAEDMQFYYNEADENSGILMMVAFRDSYMLTLDAATPEIVRAMAGKPAREGAGDERIWFFTPTQAPPENSHYMEYEYGGYRVTFYFMNDLLMCVSLCDSKKWDAVHPRGGEEAASGASSAVSPGAGSAASRQAESGESE